MFSPIEKVQLFIADEEGAVAIEYALLAALIAVVIAGGASLLGTNIDTLFTNIANCLPDPTNCTLF